MHRRHFLRSAGFATVCSSTLFDSTGIAAESDEFVANGRSILQGLTDAERTQINIVRPQARIWSYRAFDIGKGEPVPVTLPATHDYPGERTVVDKIEIRGLELGRDYKLEVLGPDGDVIDERTFRSLDLGKSGLKFAVVSCMSDMVSAVQEEMWDALVKTKPEMIFMVGDIAYTDTFGATDEGRLWKRFADSRNGIAVYRAKTLIPTLVTWDDHDFGGNNLGREYKYIPGSTRNFLTYAAQDPWSGGPLSSGPGVSHCFEAFGLRFQLMDCRSFRSRRNDSNDNTHWGSQQEDWLLNCLQRETRPTFVMNGSQIYGGYLRKDSYEYNHTDSLARITQEIKRANSPIVWVTGDIHASELSRIEPEKLGYETYEIVSSGIHSFITPFFPTPRNPRRVGGKIDYNFTVVEANPLSAESVDLRITAYTRGRRILYRHEALVSR